MTENDNKDNINNNLNDEQADKQVSPDVNHTGQPELFDTNENKSGNSTPEALPAYNVESAPVSKPKEEKQPEQSAKKPLASKESNYQISLIDENVLQIKIATNKSVSVDCAVRDKSSNRTSEKQSNKIYIHPKDTVGKQEIEIFVRIGPGGELEITGIPASDTEAEKKKPFEEVSVSERKLTPNPIVADILQRFSNRQTEEAGTSESDEPKTPEEILEERLGRKNPWRMYKQLLFRNLQRGFISAIIITFVATMVFYAAFSKDKKEEEVLEQKRLIVMQDLPENLNKMNENVDDPNKPPEPPKDENTSTTGSNVIPPVSPKKIKPPKITTPKVITPPITDTNISKTNNELDSLRKKNITGNNNSNNTNGKDTGKVNTSLMPDSLLKNLAANEVGLVGKFPPNWKQIDSRDINQKDVFQGVLLVDTTAKRKDEALNMNVLLDSKGDYYKQYSFTNVLDQDSSRTVYSIEPKIEGKVSYYRFYIANKIQNVFISAFVSPSMMDKYKPEIEQVVKTIRIQKPQ